MLLVQYPVRWTAQKRFTLFFPWQTWSFWHQLVFSEKHSSHAAITARKLFTHISTTVYRQVLTYTAVHLSELGRRGENENAQASKTASQRIQTELSRLRVRTSTSELPRSTIGATDIFMHDTSAAII